MSQYFADVSASKESQFFNTPHEVKDTEIIKALRLRAHENAKDYSCRIDLGKALSFQLRYREAIEAYTQAIELKPDDPQGYRSRAPRYLSTLQLDKALLDYQHCNALMPHSLEVIYRLGITEYLRANYEGAIELLALAMQLVRDGEMQIAILYWHTMSCYRMGNTALADSFIKEHFCEEMGVGHHTAYLNAIKVCGGISEMDNIVSQLDTEADDLEYVTAMYGVCLWLETAGKAEYAESLRKKLLLRDRFWPCFAYLAAYNDAAADAAKGEPNCITEV